MRTPIVAGNWKMNKTRDEAVTLASGLKEGLAGFVGVKVVICPVATVLGSVTDTLTDSKIEVSGQNCYHAESGAFTGELSPQMLQDAGCTWTLIGHSERRQYFGETDTLLNEKLKFALVTGLNVIFCIGETLDEREGGTMDEVLTRQLVEGLAGITDDDFKNVVVAYEPVWAIGTGLTATPEQAEEAHAFVRNVVKENFNGTVADGLRIQYGGSVKPDNAAELLGQPNIDGALVGGAALDADGFVAIVRAAL